MSISARVTNAERSGDSRHFWWRFQRKAVPYLFIAPFFILFIVFFLGPALFAFYAGFHDWSLLGKMKFVALKNYRLLIRDDTFWLSVRNTLVYIASALVLQWPLSLMLAVVLNSKALRGRRILSPIYFIPVLTSTVVVAIVFVLFLDQKYGLFQIPVIALGLEPINWLGTRELSKVSVIILLVWRWTGYNMVLFLASLQSVPQELYEAAWVDGANSRQTFRHITIPMLRPAIAYVMILGIIGGWQIFNEPHILTGGGPSDSSLSVANFLFRMSIENLRMGYGSAVGTVLFVFVFAISIFQMRFFGIYSEEE